MERIFLVHQCDCLNESILKLANSSALITVLYSVRCNFVLTVLTFVLTCVAVGIANIASSKTGALHMLRGAFDWNF